MAGNIAKANDLNYGKGIFLKIILIFNLIFLLSPLMIVIFYSFNSSKNVSYWGGFSFKWYKEVLTDYFLWIAIKNSLIIAIINMIVSTILATMLALAIGKYTFRGKQLLLNLIYIPIILPEIIFGISLLSLYILIKFPLGIISIICSHITFSISFVALIILAKIEHLDKNLEEASLDLGASRWYTFRRVIFPVIAPGIISGALFAFTLSIDDFVATFFTSGSGSSTLPLKIYSLVKFSPTPALNAISTILILFTVAALFFSMRIQKSAKFKKHARIGVAAAVCIIIAILSISAMMTHGKKTLRILNYSGYISADLIKNFEKEFNVQTQIDFMNDNEELLSKLQLGATEYDLVFPSSYMVEILIKEGLLAEMDYKNIPNIKYFDPRFRNMDYDPQSKYSVPYAYGFTGIAYNSNVITEKVDSLKIMWDEKYKGKILMTDDMREVFNYAFLYLGYSLNDKNPEQLKEAFNLLLKQKPLLKKYDSNMATDYLISGEVLLAQTWSGAMYRMALDHPEMKFCVPKEGKTLFIDNFCIPKSASNKELAEIFINYILKPENTAHNIKKIKYAMPNLEAMKYLDTAMKEDPILFPKLDASEQLQIVNELGEFNTLVDKAWIELKSR